MAATTNMKTKFLLSLLALNGLLCASSASASTGSPSDNYHQSQISQTISALIGLSADDRILLELAIDRALIAQAAPGNQPPLPMITAGVPLPVPPPQPVIRGRTAKPTPPPSQQSIGQHRRQLPNDPPQQPSPPSDTPPETNTKVRG
jgi:hypothetical protein